MGVGPSAESVTAKVRADELQQRELFGRLHAPTLPELRNTPASHERYAFCLNVGDDAREETITAEQFHRIALPKFRARGVEHLALCAELADVTESHRCDTEAEGGGTHGTLPVYTYSDGQLVPGNSELYVALSTHAAAVVTDWLIGERAFIEHTVNSFAAELASSAAGEECAFFYDLVHTMRDNKVRAFIFTHRHGTKRAGKRAGPDDAASS